MGQVVGKSTRTTKLPKLSEGAKHAIQLKLKKSPKVADSFTVIDDWHKPSTFLKFSYKGPVLYVAISKKKIIYRDGKHVHESNYLGKFKATDLINDE